MTFRRCALVVFAFAVACAAPPAPVAPAVAAVMEDAAAPDAAHAPKPEVVLSAHAASARWLAIAGGYLYVAGDDVLERARLGDPPLAAEVMLAGRGMRVVAAGDAALALRGSGEDEQALLVDAAGHATALGPAREAVWDEARRRVLIERPPADDERVEIVEVPGGDAARTKALATFRDPSVDPAVTALAASPGGFLVALANRAPGFLPGERVFSFAEASGRWSTLFEEQTAYHLDVHGSVVVARGLKIVLHDLATGAVAETGPYADACADDRGVHYCVVTFLRPPDTPLSFESFELFAWRPGAPRRVVAKDLTDLDGGIALDDRYVYWSERDGSVKRLPRVAGY